MKNKNKFELILILHAYSHTIDCALDSRYTILIPAPEGLLKNLKLIMNFFNGLATEFGKITWPSWAEAVGHAILVIVIAVLVGYYLGLLDAVFANVLKLIIG